MRMTNIESLKSKKEDKKAKSQIVKDLQEVTSILEKLEKLTTDNNQLDSNDIENTKKLNNKVEEEESTDFFDEEEEEEELFTTENSVQIDLVVEKIEELLIIQLKDAITRILETMVSPNVRMSMQIILEQKKEIKDLLKFYRIIKMIGIMEATGSESNFILPFLLNKKF